MRKSLLAVLSLAALGVSSPLFAAEPALGRLVPADVALVAALNDVPALRRAFPDTATGRAWADPEIARFFAPLLAQADVAEFVAKVKAETGYTPEELLEFASGDLLLTVPASSITLKDGKPALEALLAIEVGENESRLRELIAAQNARRAGTPEAPSTEDYNGATLHLHAKPGEGGDDVVWALHEGRWFIASDRALVTAALDALTIAPEKISNSGTYLGLRVGYERLVNAHDDDDLRKVLDYLWTMARAIEDGDMSDAAERPQAAREALEQAVAEIADRHGLAAGDKVTLSGVRGSVTLPVGFADLPDNVVWAPANTGGVNLNRDLGAAGSAVRVGGAA